MRNLGYFLHYHQGDSREKTIKIVGSLFIVTMLFVLGGAGRVSSAAQQYADLAAAFVPEPGYLIAQVETPAASSDTQVVSAPSVTPVLTGETCKVDGVEMPGPCSNYPPQGELKDAGQNQPAPPSPQDDEERDRMERQNTLRWKQDKLREWKDQLREVSKVRQQLVRLKSSQEEMSKLDAIKTRLVQCQTQLNAANNTDAMKDVLEGEECGDSGEMWEEINRIRQAVEIPKELNNILRDLNRTKNLCKQKWVDKVFSREECNTIMTNFAAKHAEAKAAYQAGEYEDARTILQDAFHEPGWPGDVNGALQMMRGFTEPLRRIKDPELKAQLDELLTPVKEALREGEYREARETMDAIQRELGQKMFNLIFDSERRRRAVPDSVLQGIERLQQKFESMEQHAAPPELAPQPVQ